MCFWGLNPSPGIRVLSSGTSEKQFKDCRWQLRPGLTVVSTKYESMERDAHLFNLSPESKIHRLPWPLRIAVYALGPLIGAILWCIIKLLHASCRVVELWDEPGEGNQPCIHAVWHGDFILYLCGVFRFRRHAWLHHDGLYLSPGLWTLWWMGIERFVPISKAHPGRLAAEKLTEHLKNGYSTFITPDGPFGPEKEVKNGVLHLSQRTRLPVVPLRIECDRALRLPTWDKKEIPLPFSTIVIRYGAPFLVDEENFEDCRAILKKELDGGVQTQPS